MGNSTNNDVEFGALELGLEILSHKRMKNTTMEGYSTLVINMVKRLQNGTRVGKVQCHWHLSHSLQKIQEHLRTLNIVELCWVHRSVNSLVDRIATEGVGKEGPELDDTWIIISSRKLRTNCNHLAAKDHEGSLSMEGHIEEDIARPLGRYEGSR
jgi:ribonuclease HI